MKKLVIGLFTLASLSSFAQGSCIPGGGGCYNSNQCCGALLCIGFSCTNCPGGACLETEDLEDLSKSKIKEILKNQIEIQKDVEYRIKKNKSLVY